MPSTVIVSHAGSDVNERFHTCSLPVLINRDYLAYSGFILTYTFKWNQYGQLWRFLHKTDALLCCPHPGETV